MEQVNETEYRKLRAVFIRIARSRSPKGLELLKQNNSRSEKIGQAANSQKFIGNEVVLMLFQFLATAFENKDEALRDSIGDRILEDIISGRC